MFAIALQVSLRAVKIRQLPLMFAPPKRQVNIELLTAWLAYETLAVIAAILPSNQNASGAIGNCCACPSVFTSAFSAFSAAFSPCQDEESTNFSVLEQNLLASST